MDVWQFVSVGALSYALGSIPSGVIAARAFARVDVCAVGSGHTGALNTYRAAGFGAAALTLLADGAKGLLAVVATRVLLSDEWAVAGAATLVVVGHCWPLYTRGRGGMGMTTAGAVFLIVQPLVLLPLAAVWLALKKIGRESLYASSAVAVLLPLALLALRADSPIIAAGIGIGGVLFARHVQVWMMTRRPIQHTERSE